MGGMNPEELRRLRRRMADPRRWSVRLESPIMVDMGRQAPTNEDVVDTLLNNIQDDGDGSTLGPTLIKQISKSLTNGTYSSISFGAIADICEGTLNWRIVRDIGGVEKTEWGSCHVVLLADDATAEVSWEENYADGEDGCQLDDPPFTALVAGSPSQLWLRVWLDGSGNNGILRGNLRTSEI